MENFIQAAAVVLLTVIAAMTLDGHARTTAVMLVMIVCIMVLISGIRFLRPILDFMRTLSEMTMLQDGILSVLFKALGIAAVSEIAVLICNDSGHGSLGKALQMLSNCVILWLSLPLFQALMDLLQKIMEAI